MGRYGLILAVAQLSAAANAMQLEQLDIKASNRESYSECILRLVDSSTAATAADIKARCQREQLQLADLVEREPESEIEERIKEERSTLFDEFVLTPHKPNYILPISYNQSPNDILAPTGVEVDKNEVQFQVSLKFPLATNIFASEWDIYAAYTGRSFWQAYNSDVSSPFRDTNHEPEVWLSRKFEQPMGPLVARALRLGFVHQSNGRSQLLSRSWNRIYADFIFEWDRFAFSFKPWYRIPESAKENPLDPAGDDNPDIEDYLGHFELLSAYKYNDHTFSVMLRNNLHANNKGAVDLSWSFPLGGKVKGYVKYFNGYGETLLDYNHRSNRLSLGFVVADWL